MLKNKKKRIFISLVLSFLCIIGFISWLYINDYYHANNYAIEELKSDDDVTVKKLDSKTYVFEPKNPTMGMIFYPGGKVEYTAYAPLMHALAREGVLCILPKMPANLAVFAPNAADGLKSKYPKISSWYMAGHSLGGVMASKYISKHVADFDGLLLLGSYSTSDLSNSGLAVISLYGSEDKVLNHERYESSRENLPENAYEYVIEGGCHAFFGSYGKQSGDGTPSISPEAQVHITVEQFLRNPFVKLFGLYTQSE